MKALMTVAAVVIMYVSHGGAAQASDKHLFYVHGCCVQSESDPKAKDYETIVQKLRDSGFNVEYQLRTADIGDNDAAVQSYAVQIADKVNALLVKGVDPRKITVTGYSLGAMTSLVAAGLVANPKINIVLLAGCPTNASIPVTIDYARVKGRVLAIVDTNDDKFGSCEGRFARDGVALKEVSISSGKGHAGFRIPKDKFMEQWMGPMKDWIND